MRPDNLKGIKVPVCFNQFIVEYLVAYQYVLLLKAAGKGVEFCQFLVKYLGLYKISVALRFDYISISLELIQCSADSRTAHMIHVAEHTLRRQRFVLKVCAIPYFFEQIIIYLTIQRQSFHFCSPLFLDYSNRANRSQANKTCSTLVCIQYAYHR